MPSNSADKTKATTTTLFIISSLGPHTFYHYFLLSTHTHTHTHTTHTYTHTHTLSLSFYSLTYKHTHTLSHSLLSQIHTHTHIHSNILTTCLECIKNENDKNKNSLIKSNLKTLYQNE